MGEPTDDELEELSYEILNDIEFGGSRTERLRALFDAGKRAGLAEARRRIAAVPTRELAALRYGEGTCTDFEELVAEYEEADEDEKEHTTLAMIEEGAEALRAGLLAALGADDAAAAPEAEATRGVYLGPEGEP